MAFSTPDPDNELEGSTPDEKIISEAQKRFARCEDWEHDCRDLYIDDIKFANADSDNLYQWKQGVRTARGYGTIDERPCLTINKVRQHCLQIINDAKQNKPSVKIKATGNGATYESAQIYEGVVRHIEYISNAQSAYDWATTTQVQGGIGYWRVVTDYVDDGSFDQEIFIRRIKDPMCVYLDPDIREVDGSDARFAFIFDDLSREEFNAAYPEYKDMATKDPLGNAGLVTSWLEKDHVRVAEYYRLTPKKDQLVKMVDPNGGQEIILRRSKIDKEIFKMIADDPQTKYRDIVENKVEHFLIVGDKVAEKHEWAGKYIPVVRVIGEETIIEGELDRKGHTRAMKDPQRIYNYWSSSAVEMVALQSKTPYVGAMESFENLETYWDSANTVNHAWLPYNAYDDKGQLLPAPKRQEAPMMASAYLQGMQVSSEEIRAVSGQYQSEMGMPSNEKSGVAIQQRQRQGDNATYHYIDNLALGIRFTGKILIDLIPKIYDTPRIIKIMAEDGVENEVTIDPKATEAYLEKQKETKDKIESIFNPNVGKYDVEADVGPAYATRRQEAFNAFTEIMRASPDLMKVAGDLMFKAADFPMADVLADRLKKMIPPELLGDAPPPIVGQMQQQMQNMQGIIQQLTEALAEEKADKNLEGEQKKIDEYKALTDRIKVLLPTIINPADIARMTHDLIKQERAANLSMDQAEHGMGLGMMSAEHGADLQAQQAQAMPEQQPQQAAA